MMMEQQTTLRNSVSQEKWKLCMSTTCYAYRMVDRIEEFTTIVKEVVRKIINSLAEVFKPIMDIFKDLVENVENIFHVDVKIYTQGYPQYIDSLKVNTKGFPRPIVRCARSRC